eukprot:4758118-Pyramimonas_sp.AAC.3
MAIEDNGTMTATAKKRCDEKEQDEDLAWESDPFYNTVREYVAKLLQDKRMSTGSCKGWLRAKHGTREHMPEAPCGGARAPATLTSLSCSLSEGSSVAQGSAFV